MHVVFSRPAGVPAALAIAFLLLVLGISGCGNNPSRQRDIAADENADEVAAGADEEAPKRSKAGKGKKKTKGDELAHIGEIPVDVWPEVWFKQPLSVASESGAAPGSAAAPATVEEAGAAPASDVAVNHARTAVPETKSLSNDWAALITGEVLADESKAIKNSLTQKMQDVGRYNSTYKDLRVDATVMVVLAAIAPDVPESPRWKSNAKFIRDASSRIAAESTANGQKFYDKARKEYDKLDALLSGSKPPNVEETADTIHFSEVANRYYLMKRMERTTNWMKSDVNSEAIFKKEGAKLTQEASLLALIGKVIATPDYSDHDIDEYKSFAGVVSESGRTIVTAVKEGDFQAYLTALDSCQKACIKCHEQFKNN